MSMQQCPNGHLYDDSRNSWCPYCNTGELMDHIRMTDASSGIYEREDSSGEYRDKASQSKVKDEAPYIFISYAHSDKNEVMDVIEFLKANHFNLWYDEGIKSGYEWADEISRKIKKCKQFICFISQSSIASESVKDEVHIAWKYNINTIVVYLEKVYLDGGLEMKLDRKQAVLKYTMSEEEFKNKLSLSISQDVVNLKDNNAPNDMRINDRYEVINLLSKGGTATTYLARNKMTGVKVVLKHGVYDDTVSGKRIKRGFEQERDILSKNISPFVPALYDYFSDSKNIYLIESYIEGDNLNSIINLSICEKLELFISAAKVIRECHKMGIYHCDIKPEHIIINNHGCFLIDFGSAEDINTVEEDHTRMGTVTYAAPEQFVSYNGENDIFGSYQSDDNSFDSQNKIDCRTDIYAFGRVMVKIISDTGDDVGSMSFPVTTLLTTALLADETKTMGKVTDNPLLLAIIEKMVREKPSNRYNNMDEVIRVLEDFIKIYKSRA